MRANINLGRLFGIPIGLHYSWFIIAGLITVSLGTRFAATNPSTPPGMIWAAALVTALLFFASLILHELSHAIVARRARLPVRSITLFALGGVAQIDSESTSAKGEFWMAIVGPLTSAGIGIGCVAAARALGWSADGRDPNLVMSILGWLGYVNLGLAVFNMLPGYPLDGGRILRAVLWWRSGNAARATRQAARAGQMVAGLFISFGLISFVTGLYGGGLWLAFIGWFLMQAAQASYLQVSITEGLRDVHVDDVMARECGVVNAAQSLRSFVDEMLLRSGRECFVVDRDGQSVGLITPHEVKKIDRDAWSRTPVGEAMRPLTDFPSVTPATSANEALTIMNRAETRQLPVISNGHLDGVVTLTEILRLVQARAELGVA
jgi:Zn-dependent protease/CBS domain-containing protein